jgi:hypothetical protein
MNINRIIINELLSTKSWKKEKVGVNKEWIINRVKINENHSLFGMG